MLLPVPYFPMCLILSIHLGADQKLVEPFDYVRYHQHCCRLPKIVVFSETSKKSSILLFTTVY